MNKKSNSFNVVTLVMLSVVLGFSLTSINSNIPAKTRLEGQMEEYLEKQAFSLTGNIRSHFVSHLIATAKDHQFDPWLILAIIKVESSFKSHVVSNRGAIGLLQLKTIAAKEVSIKFNEKNVGRHELFNPFINVKIGIQYLSCLRNQVGRDQSRILAAYNAGPTMLKQNAGVSSGYAFKVLRAYRELSKKS